MNKKNDDEYPIRKRGREVMTLCIDFLPKEDATSSLREIRGIRGHISKRRDRLRGEKL